MLAAISLGGMLGASARYAVAQAFGDRPGSFPWSTFAENISGSFLLAATLIVVVDRFPPWAHLLPFAGTGFLGSYTTFSALMVEADLLVRHGHAVLAGLYWAASLAGGVAAAGAGIVIARRLVEAPVRRHAAESRERS